jgi:CHAT domain-containing protein
MKNPTNQACLCHFLKGWFFTPLSFMFLFLALLMPALASVPQTGSAKPIDEGKGSGNIDELIPGVTVERDLRGGEEQFYQITLAAEQYLRVFFRESPGGIILTLFGPNGERIYELDELMGNRGEWVVSVVAASSGVYRLRLYYPQRYTGPIHCEVKIEELRPKAPEDDTRVAAERGFIEANKMRSQIERQSIQASVKKFLEVLELWRKLRDMRGEALTLIYLGEAHHKLGDNQATIDYHNQALNLYKNLGDRYGEAMAASFLGGDYLLSDREKVLYHLNQALELYRAIGNDLWAAHTLGNIAACYNMLGEKQKQIYYLNQSLVCYRKAGSRLGEGSVLTQLGRAYILIGENSKGVECLNEAFLIYKNLEDRINLARTLNAIGSFYNLLSETQKAIEYFNQALEIEQAIGERISEAWTLNGLGEVYLRTGERDKAISFLNKALSIFLELSDQRGQVMLFNNIGHFYSLSSEKDLALDYYRKAVRLCRELDDPFLESLILSNIGNLNRSMGQFQQALDTYNEALKRNQDRNDLYKCYTLGGIGDVYKDVGEQEKAISFLNDALKIARYIGERREEAYLLYSLAQCERSIGLLTKARSDIEDALSIIESIRINILSQETRNVYFASVREFYEFYIDVLMQLHKEQPSSGFSVLALQASERARARSLVELLNEARIDIRQGVNPGLIELERSLKERLDAKAYYQVRLLNSKHTEEQRVAIAQEINAITAQYKDVQAQIRVKSPNYAALTQPPPVDFKQIQKQILDSDTMLLEYWIGPNKSYLWAVTHDSITSFELPGRIEITARAMEAYGYINLHQKMFLKPGEHLRALVAWSNEEYKKVAFQLSDMLLGPIASQLGSKRLLIIADGEIQLLPFAALPLPHAAQAMTTNSAKKALSIDSDPTPLVVEHEIVGLPSASVLFRLYNDDTLTKDVPKSIAVFADPVFEEDDPRISNSNGKIANRGQHSKSSPLLRSAREVGLLGNDDSFPRLQATQEEAEFIFSSAPSITTLKALGFKATKDAAIDPKLNKYKIVHFATHGLLNTEHPELSGIVLSLYNEQGNPQDGFLRLNDIYNTKAYSDLVVLSACSTGFGQDNKGEGVNGLTRAFMYAGAKSVVASLWKVEDEATLELMKRFYKRMLVENMRPAAALQVAQREMLKQRRWKSPYFWAGFTIQGKWK